VAYASSRGTATSRGLGSEAEGKPVVSGINFPDFTDHTSTHIVAVGATVSPLWLHHLSDLSQEVLPIMGLVWLVIQAAVFLYKTFLRKKPSVPENH